MVVEPGAISPEAITTTVFSVVPGAIVIVWLPVSAGVASVITPAPSKLCARPIDPLSKFNVETESGILTAIVSSSCLLAMKPSVVVPPISTVPGWMFQSLILPGRVAVSSATAILTSI